MIQNGNSAQQNNNFQTGSNFNYTNQDFNSQRPRKKCNCNGRSAKIDPDLYYKLKEENELLKKAKLAQDERVKRLEVSLANIKENIIKERKQSEYKMVGSNQDYLPELQKTKYENQKLKNENEKKNLIIQGLQSNTLILKAKEKSKNKQRPKSREPLRYQKERKEQMALIELLREKLKIANEDRHTLIKELGKRQLSNNNNNNFNNNYNDQNILRSKNDNSIETEARLEAKNKVIETIKISMNNYVEKYEKERDENRKLQAELSKLKGETEKIEQYKSLINDLKNNEKLLEKELDEYRVSPFIKQAEERGNVFKNYQIAEKKLQDTKKILEQREKELQEDEVRIRELEKENRKLKEDYAKVEIEKDRYKEELLKLKINQQEREKNDKVFQDKLNQFIQYGQIDPNFAKMLSLVKFQHNDINWSNLNINYLETDEEKANDPIYLKSQIEKLKLEKAELGEELETTKSLLLTQQQINDDTKKLQECDNKKYQAEIKLLKSKIEELVKLIDVKNLPKEFLVQDPVTGTVNLKDKNALLNDLIPEEQKDPNLLNDNITEFSQEETEEELAMNENALDIFFGECIYEDGLGEELGFSIDHMLSFFSVDFFIHETQTSDILNGKTPMFNFQLTFKVDVNENLMNYLESEFINIEIYSLRDNVQTIFGKGKISLKELIEIEKSPQSSSRVINSICSLYYIKDQNLKIASIHYKMRMRKPLSETLKWYHAQNQFIREQNPMHDVVVTKAEETIERYAYLGGKSYDIKILISKAVGLVATGILGRISPYFYYKFYKDGERYSQISSGTDPIFEDVASFKTIYNKDLIDYLEKESLNVYLFDSMNKIEIDVNDKEQIKLVNSKQEISKDLIGISRIPLKGLLINDLVQGEFPIVNMKNQNVGKIIVNIFWEEIVPGRNTGLNDMPYETEAYKDELIVRLSNVFKSKGLNMDSAFLIFDVDKNGEITIDNFKNVLIFILKFSTNQSEIEHLIKILFTDQGRTKLTKMDFFKIFSLLLPHEGPASSIMKNSTNQLEDNNSEKNSNISPLQTNKAYSKKESKFSINTKREKRSSNSPSVNINLNKETETNKNLGETTVNVNTNRSLQELGKLAYEYKMKMGGDWSKLFINVDVDGSLGIDKTELRKGYKKMGIELSDVELNKLWRELSPDNKNIDFIRFKTFHEKIFKPNRRKSIPIQSDILSNRDNVSLKTDKNE